MHELAYAQDIVTILEGQLAGEAHRSRIPLIVSGYVPEPMSILDRLWEIGGMIVADDYAAVGRRLPLEPSPSDKQVFLSVIFGS